MLRGQIHRSKIEDIESNNAKYNSNHEMAFGTDQSSNFFASAIVVYPKQDLQVSVTASGSGDPPKPHIPIERERFTNAKDNLNFLDLLLRHNALVGGHPGPRKKADEHSSTR